MDNYIAEIIKEYLTKRYPEETEEKIRSWLVNEEYAEEKNDALSAYWDLLHVDPDIFVYESLEQVKQRMLHQPQAEMPAQVEEEKIEYPSDIPATPLAEELLPILPKPEEPENPIEQPVLPVISLSPADVIETPVYETPVETKQPETKTPDNSGDQEKQQRPVIIQLREPEPVEETTSPSPRHTVMEPEPKKEKILFPEELITDEKVQNTFYWGKIVAVIIPFLFILMGAYFYISHKDTTETIVNLSVPYGETQQIQLPDGSVVWLNAGSTLHYPEEFRAAERRVQLNGEGYFSVAGNIKKPFKVETTSFTIEVVGTEFNVMAYTGDEHASTTLTSGKVKIETVAKEKYELVPAQQLSYNVNTAETMIRTVTPETEAQWREGHIIFKDTSFDEILKTLQRQLNIQFRVNESFVKPEETYTVKFVNNESIEEILTILQEMINFTWHKENNTININSRK